MKSRSWPPWCCPRHHEELAVEGARLGCPAGCRFDVRKGIPRFVADPSYASAFGVQWLRYARTQLDSNTGVPVSERRLRRCLGEELWSGLADAQVLEAGCGAGRFTEVLLGRGAHVTSVDLSDAVEANQDNFPQGEFHRIAQADILRLPFSRRQFDLVLCMGVIQHTPVPEETIAGLFDHVRPGGWLVLDHYTYQLSYFTKTAPFLRAVLRRLDPAIGLSVTEKIVRALLPLHRALRNWYVGQALVSRLSPVIAYYHQIPELSEKLQEEWALLDTHDSLTDWYKHFRTRGQIRRVLGAVGAVNVSSEYGGNGVEARGQRQRES